jgi:hypothetical protein
MFGNLLRRLHQLPVVLAWKFLILLARKSYHLNIVICDVTSTESRYRDCFADDVKSALDDLAVTSPEVLRRAQHYIGYIARADISNRYEYFSSPRLLLLYVDYQHGDVDVRGSLKRDILEVATLAHLRSERDGGLRQNARV